MSPLFELLFELSLGPFGSAAGSVRKSVALIHGSELVGLRFNPHDPWAEAAFAPPGMLGRMARQQCAVELFDRAPTGEQVMNCFIKHGTFCRSLQQETKKPVRLPMQWILCARRPDKAIEGYSFVRSSLESATYDGPPLLHSKIVVLSELPCTRDTLLLRLLAAGSTQRKAVADLLALRPDAVESRIALPILAKLRSQMQGAASELTRMDREFLANTKDVDAHVRPIECLTQEDLRAERSRQIDREGILSAYRTRFGAAPRPIVEALEKMEDDATLESWLKVVATGSAEDVTAAMCPARRSSPLSR